MDPKFPVSVSENLGGSSWQIQNSGFRIGVAEFSIELTSFVCLLAFFFHKWMDIFKKW